MKKFLLIVLLFASSIGFSQITMVNEVLYSNNEKLSGTYVEYHDNGNLKIIADYKNGIEHGNVIKYSTEGVKISKLSYKNGIFHGEFKKWDNHGNLLGVGYYKDGKKDKLWKIYINDILKAEILYDNGKKINAVSY